MIQITDKKKCCGCNSCGDICPKNAILFSTDNEGFWYPKVNRDTCINCGLCEKVCPILHVSDLKKNDFDESICYAAEHKNLEIVFDSTSGGLFSALAESMYRKGGFVGGAIFDEELSVKHFISLNKKDLIKLRSSKYSQSNAAGFYKEVKKLLLEEKNVLVCGTPCQMAALRSFLGRDYSNLIIVDFICRGINSPKIWKKYLNSFEERYKSKVVFAKAKSKEYGWRNLTQKVQLEDGRIFFETFSESNFTQGYLRTNAYCRPSCYDCQFKGFPRIADITLADFWGIEKFDKSMEKDLGTSLVMINSIKGKSFFEQIKKKINFREMPFSSILEGNPALIKPLDLPKVNRNDFFKDVDSMSFIELANTYIKTDDNSFVYKAKREIRNFIRFAGFVRKIIRVTRFSPKALYQTVHYSGIKNIIHRKGIIFSTNCTTNISNDATIDIQGVLTFGDKNKFPNSSLESRICLDAGAKLAVLGDTVLGYGCDIEVFKNAKLTFQGGRYLGSSGANIGLTVICGESIQIGADVQIGRNVTIRDNNGGHYINRQGYKNTKGVTIGEKVWLCEGCTIMSGANIGNGSVVGAKSFVIGHIPAHSMVMGYPAKVVDEDIQWKY